MNKLLQQIKSTKYLNAAALQCLIVSLSALTLHEIFQLKDRSVIKWGKERRGGGLEKNKSYYSVCVHSERRVSEVPFSQSPCHSNICGSYTENDTDTVH